MPFVHVIDEVRVMTQLLQHRHPSQSQNGLLPQPVARVASVEMVCEGLILRMILRQRRVQKEHREGVPGHPGQTIKPGADPDRACADLYSDGGGNRFENVLWRPDVRMLRLRSLRVQLLAEVSPSRKQRDARHGDAEVGGGA